MKSRRSSVHSPGRGRLSRSRERLVYGIFGALWASGVAWLVYRYFLRAGSEFGETPHPLEAWWMRLHGLAAFAGLWLLGVLWVTHIVPAWRTQRRWSGIALASIALLLVLSGYLLYYAGDERLRAFVSLAHWMIGIALAPLLLWHVLRRRTRSRKT
jgi:hypothetical protein